jgi:hypothetical protein
MPIAAHHFAARRARSDMSDQFVFFNAESHWESPELAIIGIWRTYIRERTGVSTAQRERFLTAFEMTTIAHGASFPHVFSGNPGELRLVLESPLALRGSTRLHSKIIDILPDSLAL